jgi:hypothetical protein
MGAWTPASNHDERLSAVARWKIAAAALGFWAVFTGIFALAVAFGEPLADFRKYPLDPQGWFVVRLDDGSIVREANLWDMIKAKYLMLLLLGGYVAGIVFTMYVVVLAVRGKQNTITNWILAELSQKSFRLSR